MIWQCTMEFVTPAVVEDGTLQQINAENGMENAESGKEILHQTTADDTQEVSGLYKFQADQGHGRHAIHHEGTVHKGHSSQTTGARSPSDVFTEEQLNIIEKHTDDIELFRILDDNEPQATAHSEEAHIKQLVQLGIECEKNAALGILEKSRRYQ